MKGSAETLLVGLTGGIAAGKSNVASLLAALGAVVVDADQVAREVVAKGSDTLAAIVAAFGEGVLMPGGELDREALGTIVFSDLEAKQRLEGITHPAIGQASRSLFRRLAREGARLVVYEAALLVESGRCHEMDTVVVVVADDQLRLQRLMARDGISEEMARRRMSAQMDQVERARAADHVIDNSGSERGLQQAVAELWRKLQAVDPAGDGAIGDSEK